VQERFFLDASNTRPNDPTPLNGHARALPPPGRAAPTGRKRKSARHRRKPAFVPLSPRAQQAQTWATRALLTLLAFACGPLVLWTAPGQRALPALGIGGILFMLLLRSPSGGVVLTLVFLSLLGGVRRWIIPTLGWMSTDPLLLVGPVLVMGQLLNLVMTRRIPHDTRLARTLLWLLALMFLQVFNPLQGGIGVGLAGMMFTIVPVLWYYYGRTQGSETVLRRLLIGAVGVALAAGLYGLHQTYFGLLPSEKQWVDLTKASNNALYIGDNAIRAFSFFTSAQEYVQFLSIGVVVLWAAFLRGARQALLPLPFLVIMIFLSSIRGAVVMTLLTCVVLWTIQGRTVAAWAPRLALAIVLATSGLFWSLHKVQENTYDYQTQLLVNHQVNGLLKPVAEMKTSTASTHAAMLGIGIMEGFRVPVGHGLGYTTIASSKFSATGKQGGTEWDVSDCFTALGFTGGLLYTTTVVLILAGAIRWWRAAQSLTALASVGVLIVNIGHWLHGGSYAATMLIWFVIGSMDRAQQTARRTQTQTAAASMPTPPTQPPVQDTTPKSERSAFVSQKGNAVWKRRPLRARWQVRQVRMVRPHKEVKP
jgi:hypothetical protein